MSVASSLFKGSENMGDKPTMSKPGTPGAHSKNIEVRLFESRITKNVAAAGEEGRDTGRISIGLFMDIWPEGLPFTSKLREFIGLEINLSSRWRAKEICTLGLLCSWWHGRFEICDGKDMQNYGIVFGTEQILTPTKETYSCKELAAKYIKDLPLL